MTDNRHKGIAASGVAAWDYDTTVQVQDVASDTGEHFVGIRLESTEDPEGAFMSAWLSVEQAEGLAETLQTYIAEV